MHLPYGNVLVIYTTLTNFNVKRILVNNGSSVNILFISEFDKMKIGQDRFHPFHTPLVEFRGSATHLLKWMRFLLTLGAEPHETTVWQDFIVVDCPSPYNAILGRPTLGKIKAITSTYHLMMKFSTSTRIGEVRGDHKISI